VTVHVQSFYLVHTDDDDHDALTALMSVTVTSTHGRRPILKVGDHVMYNI